MGVSVLKSTKEYFKSSDEKPGVVLDQYVNNKS